MDESTKIAKLKQELTKNRRLKSLYYKQLKKLNKECAKYFNKYQHNKLLLSTIYTQCQLKLTKENTKIQRLLRLIMYLIRKENEND